MDFPLSQREKEQIKKIGEAFGVKNPLCIPEESELLQVKETLELLIQKGYVEIVKSIGFKGYSQVEITGYKLVGRFSDFLAWIDDQEKKAKKLSRREWAIGIVGALIGAILGLIPYLLPILISLFNH